MNNLATLLVSQGQATAGEGWLRSAHSLSEKHSRADDRFSGLLQHNLGVVLRDNREFQEAEKHFNDAIRIWSERLGHNHKDVGEALSSLGRLEVMRNRLDAAEAHFRESLSIYSQVLGKESNGYARQCVNLAEVLYETGRIEEALSYLQQAGEAENVSSLKYPDIPYALGKNLAEQGRYKESVTYYRRAIEYMEQRFANTQGQSDRIRDHFFRSGDDLYLEFIEVLSNIHGQSPDSGWDKEALGIVANRQNRLFANLYLENLNSDQPQEELYTFFSLDAIQNQLGQDEILLCYVLLSRKTLIFLITADAFELLEGPAGRDELEVQIRSLRNALDLWSAIDEGASLDPVELHSLYTKLLGPTEHYMAECSLVILSLDGILHTIPFEVLVTQFGEEERLSWNLKKDDPGNMQGVFFQEYAGLSYFARKYKCVYIPSIRMIGSDIMGGSYDDEELLYNFIAFGNPVFQHRKGAFQNGKKEYQPPFQELPDTEIEIKQAAIQIGGRQRVFLGKEARKQVLKDTQLQTRYLWIATHGVLGSELMAWNSRVMQSEGAVVVSAGDSDDEESGLSLPAMLSLYGLFDPEAALLPGHRIGRFESCGAHALHLVPKGPEPVLVMSIDDESMEEQSFLTVSEIMESLDIKANLVVLSACNTLGDPEQAGEGEGFSGMARAFMVKGAKAILASHWKIDSEVTRRYMEIFLKQVESGENYSDAVHSAQNKLIEETSKRMGFKFSLAHPYFWGGFSLISFLPVPGGSRKR